MKENLKPRQMYLRAHSCAQLMERNEWNGTEKKLNAKNGDFCFKAIQLNHLAKNRCTFGLGLLATSFRWDQIDNRREK
jgi:hypothetical protein